MTAMISRQAGRAALRGFLLGCSCLVGIAGAHAEEATPAAATEGAADAGQEADPTSEVTVTGKKFNTSTTSAVNKMPQRVIDTSQAVKSFSSDELAFAGIETLSDIGKLDSGQYKTPIGSGYVTQNYFRGFGGTNTCGNFPIKVDGFRANCEMPPDLTPFATVDVLKGSSSSVYGQSFVAGTMVLNSKLPQKNFGGSISSEFGDFYNLAIQGDVYGSLTRDQNLYGRLVLNYTNEGAGFDDFTRRNLTIAPSLKWDITDRDSLTWVASYTRINNGAGFGFPLAYNASGAGGAANGANYSIPDIDINKLGFLQPDWAKQKGVWFNSSLKYEHTFGNDWHLTVGGQHYVGHYKDKFVWVGAYNTITTDKSAKTDLYLYYAEDRTSQWAGEVNLFGDVDALGHKQTFFIGGDYTKSWVNYLPYVGKYLSGSSTGFDIYNPDWSLIPEPSSLADFQGSGVYAPASYASSFKRAEVNAGVEVGAILRPTDALTINLGGRWSTDTQSNKRVCCSLPFATSVDDAASVDTRPAQRALTYQVGANYAITDDIHAYASYGTTFEAANRYAYDPANPTSIGKFLGPQKGKSAEIGVKGQLRNQSINWSIDVFDTRISNAFQTDPDHLQYSIALGAERARGVEAEFQGKILPGWDVTASMSHTQNIYTEGALKGFSSPFAVPFGFSLFSSYQIQRGPLHGLGAGGGYVLKTRAPYKLYNGADLSGLIKDDKELDLRLFYEMKFWRIDLYANNVMDYRYFAPRLTNAAGTNWYLNQPRQIYVKLTLKY